MRYGNGGMMESCVSHTALRRHGFPAAIANGKQEADQKYDGKRNKTFKYWIVGDHEVLHGKSGEADGISRYARAN